MSEYSKYAKYAVQYQRSEDSKSNSKIMSWVVFIELYSMVVLRINKLTSDYEWLQGLTCKY